MSNEIEVKKLVLMDADRVRLGDTLRKEVEQEVRKSQAVAIRCTSLEESEVANSRMVILREFVKTVEEHRLAYGRVINAFKKVWDGFWNSIKQPAEVEVARLKGMLLEYSRALEQQRIEEERKRAAEIQRREKLQAAHAAKGHVIDETPREATVPEIAPVKTKIAARTRTVWEWNDKTVKLDLVPREYMMLDSAKVTAAVRSGVREIPGIEIEPKQQVY